MDSIPLSISNATMKLKIAIGTMTSACLFNILGLATPNWASATFRRGTGHAGLWRACKSTYSKFSGNEQFCFSYRVTTDWLDASRAFGIIGVLLGVGAILLTLGNRAVDQLQKDVYYIAALVVNVLAGSILITIAIAGSKIDELPFPNVKVSWSVVLCVIGMVLHLIAAGLMGVNRNSTTTTTTTTTTQ